VKAVQLIEGEAVWEAEKDGRWSMDLLEAALSRSDTPCGRTDEDGRTQDLIRTGELYRLVENPVAYLIEHRDGFNSVLLMLNGAVRDYCFAGRLNGQLVSTQFLLTPTPNVTYSACLIRKIEEMYLTRRAPYPAERTLLVSGTLESCLKSRHSEYQRLETPHLDVAYQAPAESHHARM
jgi:hypothetical protein